MDNLLIKFIVRTVCVFVVVHGMQGKPIHFNLNNEETMGVFLVDFWRETGKTATARTAFRSFEL